MTARMQQRRTILVVGATGTVGSAVLRELLAVDDRVCVRVAVRGTSASSSFPPSVEVVHADLRDADAVGRALKGVDAALYVSPHEHDEGVLARTFVAACERAQVRIVFAGVHQSGRTLRGRLMLRLLIMLAPHYRGKFAVGQLIEQSDTRPVLLSPACFFENDDTFLPEIQAGHFPTPLRGMRRVSVCDVAVVARRALVEPDFPSGTYPLTGSETLTGTQCAAAWERGLGRPVRHTGADTVAWRRALDRAFPVLTKKKHDWLLTYRALGRVRVPVNRRDLALTRRLLGRAPMTYRQYVANALAGRHREPARGRRVCPDDRPDVALSARSIAPVG